MPSWLANPAGGHLGFGEGVSVTFFLGFGLGFGFGLALVVATEVAFAVVFAVVAAVAFAVGLTVTFAVGLGDLVAASALVLEKRSEIEIRIASFFMTAPI